MKTAKWKKNLTAKEIKHIKETTDTGTLAQVKTNLAFQAKEKITCWDCRAIAAKLKESL